MNYKYDVINYNKNIPATIILTNLNSDTQKSELQWHRETEIVFVLEGRCECSHNGEEKIVEQDDFILFNSEDVHLVRPANGTSCKLLCIQLSFEYMRMFCKPIDSVFFDVTGKPEVKQALIEELRRLAEIDNTNDDYAPLLSVAYINKIYYLLLKNCICFRRISTSEVLPKRDFSYAKTAIAYINENFKHEIPLDEISSIVNLSPSYFSKYFKSVTHVSFSEYLANLRLENAVEDMLTKGSTVSQAAFENGFANVKSFITQCKKVYDCTPAQYKKRLLNK
ncbi:MAG: helix-turn-helix domain-containing protein [Clostridia bacterium]|nr:helix-turn-helix domain-containing protein [Clostridia bacterium]